MMLSMPMFWDDMLLLYHLTLTVVDKCWYLKRKCYYSQKNCKQWFIWLNMLTILEFVLLISYLMQTVVERCLLFPHLQQTGVVVVNSGWYSIFTNSDWCDCYVVFSKTLLILLAHAANTGPCSFLCWYFKIRD